MEIVLNSVWKSGLPLQCPNFSSSTILAQIFVGFVLLPSLKLRFWRDWGLKKLILDRDWLLSLISDQIPIRCIEHPLTPCFWSLPDATRTDSSLATELGNLTKHLVSRYFLGSVFKWQFSLPVFLSEFREAWFCFSTNLLQLCAGVSCSSEISSAPIDNSFEPLNLHSNLQQSILPAWHFHFVWESCCHLGGTVRTVYRPSNAFRSLAVLLPDGCFFAWYLLVCFSCDTPARYPLEALRPFVILTLHLFISFSQTMEFKTSPKSFSSWW